MMTPEQQQRLRAALVSDEAFLEFLAQEADSPEFQAMQQRVEAGPHPADALLHEYVFGWLDAQEAAMIREHLICCRICAEEVLQFRQFEEQRAQATQAWLADAAQTSQTEAVQAAISAKPWWYPLTFLQFGAMLAAVLMLVYPHTIVEILLQISTFTRQHAAMSFGVLLIGLFALAFYDLYRHCASCSASGDQKDLLSSLCILAFLVFMLPTILFIGDFTKSIISPDFDLVEDDTSLLSLPTPVTDQTSLISETPMPGSHERYALHESIPLPTPIPKLTYIPDSKHRLKYGTSSLPVISTPISEGASLLMATMPGPDCNFAIEAVGVDYSDVFSYLMVATNLLDSGVFFASDNYEWDSYVQGPLRVNDTTTSDSLILDDVLTPSYTDMIDLDESLSFLSSVIVVSEAQSFLYKVSFCANTDEIVPIFDPSRILVRERAIVMIVGIGLLVLLGLAAKKIQRFL